MANTPRARLRFGREPAETSVRVPGAIPSPARPRRVAVLMGGPSSERAVSLRSGAAVAEALAARGFEVEWVVVDRADERTLGAIRADIAFVALHGAFGEDGGCQERLEALGLRYTGSGPLASALGFDKVAAKRRFGAAGVSTPPFVELDPLPADASALGERIASLGFPVVVKPACEGSSIGVSVVEGPDGLGAALHALEGRRALAEAFVPGRELTVGVLDDRALPIVEIVPERGYYDYRAKYDRGAGTRYVVDPALGDGEREAIQALALAAHRAIGCRGATRVDVRLDPVRGPFVLEVNTIPGMTATSLLPKAAAAAGLDFGALCERLVRLALPAATGTTARFAAAAAHRSRRAAPRAPRSPERR